MLNDKTTGLPADSKTVGNTTTGNDRNLWGEIDALKADVAALRGFLDSPTGQQLVRDTEGLANVSADIAMLKQATGLHGLEESARAIFLPNG